MSSIQKRGTSWVAEVCVDRKRKSKSFALKRDAVEWAREQEEHGVIVGKTLRQAIERYRPIAEAHKGSQPEISRLNQLDKSTLAVVSLDMLTPAKIAEYRDKRLKEVGPSSVRRELIILSALLKVARDEWGWIRSIPTESVTKPTIPPSRRRGVSDDEVKKVTEQLLKARIGKQVADMFALSIETGMRLGEICGIKWDDVADKSVTLPETKNGDRRNVPLSHKAREIISGREGIDNESVFTLSSSVASKTFQRARDKCVPDLHFHDARSEAITRLSKKLDVMQLARTIGHRDLASLMIYYSESADSLADKLG